MSNKECCNDMVQNMMSKMGVNRSMLITLALLPFSWEGVTWVAGAVRSLWNLVASV